jgi:hypothetical protein
MAILDPTASARGRAESEWLLGLGPEPGASPSYEGTGEEGGFSPSELREAYDISEFGGSGQTVAVVDAYNDPKAEADLNVYREHYRLPACTRANGCFKKVNQKGESSESEEASIYPADEPGWGLEISVDLDMVSAMCQECHIVLVEAENKEVKPMDRAENEAAALKGTTEISDSWAQQERAEEASEDAEYFDHPGIPIVASGGDDGYDDCNGGKSLCFPAASKYVIAVGGTTLKKMTKTAENPRGWEEGVWEYSGSGCSADDLEPEWQESKAFPKACGGKRTDDDVAAVASEATPVSFYDSYETSGFPFESPTGWLAMGGTSVSAPIVAGIEAHASEHTRSLGADAFYKAPGMLFHVSKGSNGSCGAESSETYYLCHATKEGYNGPTGWGTPDGVFSSAPSVSTVSATGVTETGATLRATVNPNGAASKYHFEYGETTSYGFAAAEVSAGSGITNAEEKDVVGLAPGTTYHFRAIATNGDGTTNGSDEKLTTTGTAKPSVESKLATSVTETGATLNGRVNPHGAEAKYYFEYGKTESYGSKTAEATAGAGTASVEESKAITGLAASTTYHFRMVATNSKGTTDGEDRTLTTSPKPSAETETATSISAVEATLNGAVNPRGAETKYYFEYGTEKGKLTTKTAEASAGAGTSNVEEHKAITGLTTGKEYYFRLVATNSHGTTDGSEDTFVAVLPQFELGTGEKLPVALEGAFPNAEAGVNESGGYVVSGICDGVKATGTVTGAKALSLTLVFERCREDLSECKTAGAASGEEVFSGNGTLVYISKEKKELGILWELKEAVASCSDGIESEIRGSVLAPLTPVNAKTGKADLLIEGNGVGKPNATKYENEKGEVKHAKLEAETGGGFRESAMEVEAELDLATGRSLTING